MSTAGVLERVYSTPTSGDEDAWIPLATHSRRPIRLLEGTVDVLLDDDDDYPSATLVPFEGTIDVL